VYPAQSVRQDVELARVVADDGKVGIHAMREYRCQQGTFGDDADVSLVGNAPAFERRPKWLPATTVVGRTPEINLPSAVYQFSTRYRTVSVLITSSCTSKSE
jgi:hypothetical protein